MPTNDIDIKIRGIQLAMITRQNELIRDVFSVKAEEQVFVSEGP